MNELMKIPDIIGQQLARVEEHRSELRKMAGWDHPERFCPVSLGDWLDLCRRAGVRCVPALKIAEFLREDYLAFDQQGEHQERLQEAQQAIRAARLEGEHMMRLDCCFGTEIKYRMGSGEPACLPSFQEIDIGDPRAYDIILEYPREAVPVWQRPWVRPLVEDGYPVEYRAYVRDGGIQGISSYYPQRPLAEHPEHLEAVREMTERLIAHAGAPFVWNATPMLYAEQLDLSQVHFTADFLVSEYGDVLFLEGGPPHELGAHPCCFRPGEISGIALECRPEEREQIFG